VNTLRTADGDLVAVDCGDLLEKILEVLGKRQTQNPFSIQGNGDRLLIDIDTIAEEVAGLPVENPLGASERSVRTATVNFTPVSKNVFPVKLHRLKIVCKLCWIRQLSNIINSLISNSLWLA
jgi:hypothetical protein